MNEEMLRRFLKQNLKFVLVVNEKTIFYTGKLLEIKDGVAVITDKFSQRVLLDCNQISQIIELNGGA